MKKYILFLFISFMTGSLFAQSAAEIRKLYEAGNYSGTKTALAPLMKKYARNANYNLWYGVSCLNTGDAAGAVPYLETAVKLRATTGAYHLGEAYAQTYRYEEAVNTLEDYIPELIKKKQPTDNAEQLLARCKVGLRMIRGVEEVMVVDSFVVDKEQFLQAYKIGPETGKLYTYAEYFNRNDHSEGTVYKTEMDNRVLYGELQQSGFFQLYSITKMDNQWGTPTPLPKEINQDENANYPFMMGDGVTMYYAADGDKSLGGYDIFVTRYNPDTGSYLTPENIGMPFNSPYNDYLYVIDEFNNLGWFASDRFQPEGKVCVYVFIPNETKRVYNYENMNRDEIGSLAKLSAIRQTWKDETATRNAQALVNRLITTPATSTKAASARDFEFVVDDTQTCYQLSDFKEATARETFQKYLQLERRYQDLLKKLQALRDRFANGDESTKDDILELEQNEETLYYELNQTANLVRSQERQ